MTAMKRSVLGAACAAMMLGACASVPPDDVSNACAIFEDKGGWYSATRKAEKRWGLPKAIQLAIIRQESGFDADAKPARNRFLFVFPGKRKSSARGYPQAVEGTWELYQRKSGNEGANRRSFRDAADFVSWYASETRRRVGVPLDDAYGQYLAYHEGWEGYARGSYRGKSGLQNAARAVQRGARTYQGQLNGCEKRFRRGIPLIPFI
ncbi:MAG: transglycosylase SLT domain-containing protein [Pseudomonadota bacterium]